MQVERVLFIIFITTMLLTICFITAEAGVTGKIVGKVMDLNTNRPLPSANIIIEGTTMGAASDPTGYYMIINVPPGIYTLRASMMGYKEVRIENVRVSIDLTTTVNFELAPTVIEAKKAVTVIAKRPLVRPDLTSSLAVVGTEEIKEMPVEEFREIMNLQAGVVEGHVRGGRASEVGYWVDGISVTDAYSSNIAVEVENTAIQELQLVSGTFNAEYGQAMSGIVNIVTKEGANKLQGRVSSYFGDYLSTHDEIFYNINEFYPLSVRNLELSVSGPLSDKLRFFVTGRSYYNEGWLYGKRVFLPSDSSNFDSPDPDKWYIQKSGDGRPVPMNPTSKLSGQCRLTYKISPAVKLSYNLLWDRVDYKQYDHMFKLNPDGDYQRHKRGYNHMLSLTNAVGSRTFYTLRVANFFHDYRHYVYKNPLDPRYVDPRRLATKAWSFHSGGTGMWHFYRNTTTRIGKFDLTSQITKTHQIKTGIELRHHKLWLHEFEIIPKKDESGRQIEPFQPSIGKLTDNNNNQYTHYPYEASFYIQDKMEYKDIIVNAGIRFDYFEPDGIVPTDLEDPHNDVLEVKDSLGNVIDSLDPTDPSKPWHYKYRRARPKYQINPRLGISYPITDRGVIHFSYGHFLQIPPFEYLYTNPEFELHGSGLNTVIGNADLEPQRTVMYEIGLQQQISDDIGIDVTTFYKDIRNLLGSEIQETYQRGTKYARYVNRDYGNVRGVTFSLDKRRRGLLSAAIDYTYQVAEGNASDPLAVFWDSKGKRESEKRTVPLDWDQTHTLNFTITLSEPEKFGISLIGRFGSGLPYTPEVQGTRTAFENSGRKPPQYTFDLSAHRDFRVGRLRPVTFIKVYNLFDRKNEVNVYTDTGRATYSLAYRYAGEVRGVNTLEEFLNRPDFYSEPRRVIIGIALEF